MSIFAIIAIAFAVAMDAFAVSISSGIAIREMKVRHALLIAAFFGIFQGVMPMVGWMVGEGVKAFIEPWDHWVAFGLLLGAGVKLIYESRKSQGSPPGYDPTNIYVLFILSIATSIDALAVGLTLSFVDIGIVVPVMVIGFITFIMSFAGTYTGKMLGHLLERKMELAAGLLLIAIGIKVLIEHTS
ncbi:MAG: manganese efflux pump MntP family protein [Verrucomicrobiota bacterium]